MAPSAVSALGGRTPKPNDYMCDLLYDLVKVAMAEASEDIDSRTELDSHANMVVLGKHCFVSDHIQGRTCLVESYNPAMKKANKACPSR